MSPNINILLPVRDITDILLKSIKAEKVKIILIFTVFLLFLANSVDVFNFTSFKNTHEGNSLISQIFNYQSLLNNHIFLTRDFYMLALIGTFLSILLPVLSPFKASLITIACMMIPFGIDYITPHALLLLEYTLMTTLILYIFNILLIYFIEIRAKKEIIGIFEQYIPPQLVAEISRSPGKLSMASETKEMTVLFCDIHDFTTCSELLGPEEVSSMLNIYFTEISKVLHNANATIDKFIGDAVMAFWGAPLQQEDHATLSIIASFKMHEIIDQITPIFAKNGWHAIKIGIGISTGKMHVGNMGSEYRVTYTVVGDAVNLASRLEGLTRTYGVPTIVSETTRGNNDNTLFRELDTVTVKGKKTETRIFQPLSLREQLTVDITAELEQQQQALQYYYQEKYTNSVNLFEQLAKQYPDDTYYKVMKNKVAALSQQRTTLIAK